MRTAIFVFAGFGLLLSLLLLARAFKPNIAGAARIAVPGFVVLWGLVAGVNLWIGVTQAGYGLTEELPIFLLIFLLPVAAALMVKWVWR